MKPLLTKIWNSALKLALVRKPSDGVMIGRLMDSFGHLWYTEPPMRDCYSEVTGVEQRGLKLKCTIIHVTMDVEDEDELLTGQRICGTEWNYHLELKFSLRRWCWVWVDSELIENGDKQIWIDEATDPECCYESIFGDFDWEDYLEEQEISSVELMSRFPNEYKRFYQPYHEEITS